MNFEKEQGQLLTQVSEMVESACTVKGPHFANVVNSLYALHGMRDLSGRLISVIPEGKPYTVTVDKLHSVVHDQLLCTLNEQDRKEAVNLAAQMFANQAALHARIERSA